MVMDEYVLANKQNVMKAAYGRISNLISWRQVEPQREHSHSNRIGLDLSYIYFATSFRTTQLSNRKNVYIFQQLLTTRFKVSRFRGKRLTEVGIGKMRSAAQCFSGSFNRYKVDRYGGVFTSYKC